MSSTETVKEDRPTECTICLEEYVDKIAPECCTHEFCRKCLFRWIEHKPECPLCRQVFLKIRYMLDDNEVLEDIFAHRARKIWMTLNSLNSMQIVLRGEIDGGRPPTPAIPPSGEHPGTSLQFATATIGIQTDNVETRVANGLDWLRRFEVRTNNVPLNMDTSSSSSDSPVLRRSERINPGRAEYNQAMRMFASAIPTRTSEESEAFSDSDD